MRTMVEKLTTRYSEDSTHFFLTLSVEDFEGHYSISTQDVDVVLHEKEIELAYQMLQRMKELNPKD